MGCHPSHWRTPSFFKMGTLHHQPVIRSLIHWCTLDTPGLRCFPHQACRFLYINHRFNKTVAIISVQSCFCPQVTAPNLQDLKRGDPGETHFQFPKAAHWHSFCEFCCSGWFQNPDREGMMGGFKMVQIKCAIRYTWCILGWAAMDEDLSNLFMGVERLNFTPWTSSSHSFMWQGEPPQFEVGL